MTSEPITFFDIPSKDGTPWSFNPWKSEGIPDLNVMTIKLTSDLARFLLNYKGLDYKTEWVHSPSPNRKTQALTEPPRSNTPTSNPDSSPSESSHSPSPPTAHPS